MEPIYQCCYTNATQNAGDKVTSGWQAVSVSPDIPNEAYKACVKLQNANSSLCANAVDEQGNVLVLYELFGDGAYLYVIRTQFGLRDRVGRPNLFSHAIIFPLRNNRDVLWNPNFYLALDESSFKASEDGPSWEGMPPYQQSVSLETAMGWAGLDREKYTVLVRCVYAKMNEQKSDGPLYIQYDGSKQQLLGILYCICAGIPRYMLKKLRAASCPTANDRGKDLVFSQNAHTRGNYFLPQTGENTVLTQRIERKIERYGFIDYAVRQLPPDREEFARFFDALDKAAAALGDPSASNIQILKLAFQFLWGHRNEAVFTDTELEENLSDALRLPFSGNKFAEILLTRLLSEAVRRKLSLTAESEALLDGWLSNAESGELKEAGRKYKAGAR